MFKMIVRSTLLIMSLLLTCSKSFSQRAILSDQDTTICFSVNQARFILKQINRMEYLDTLNKIQLEEINLLKQNALEYEKVIFEKNYQIELKEEEVKLKQLGLDHQIEINKSQKREILKQKLHKNIAIICGSVATGFMTYLWISK